MLLIFCGCIATACINTLGDETKDNSMPEAGDVVLTITASSLQKQIYNTDYKEYIGIYMLYGDNSLSDEHYLSNERFQCTSSGFTPDETLFYPNNKTKCELISYYPYQTEGINSSEQTLTVSVRGNQSSLIHFNQSDFMISRSPNIVPSTKAVALSHDHKFNMLNVIIKCVNNEDINALRNQNPILLINNTFCQAIYHFDSNSLTDYDTKMPITPYGQWSVQNNKLLGKKCMIIPQTLPSTSIIATLTVGYRTFECSLTEDFVLEAGKSSELILWYDPANASNQITANISDWIEGDSSEVNAEETDEKDYVSANELNFSGSHVLTVYSKGVAIARICKELLFNTQINEEALVIYQAKDNIIDDTNGFVWQICNQNGNIHGGHVKWDKADNSFTYTPGNKPFINDLYFDEDTVICIDKPVRSLFISVKDELCTDQRNKETIFYPIVKIGTSYWLKENLRATRYNNGKAITKKTASTYTKKTAGYFVNGTDIFYNKAVVLTGNLPPAGWRISNETDWEKLNNYIGGSVSYIKDNGSWVHDNYEALDYSGFSAMPTGIFTTANDNEESIYGFGNRYAAFWRMDNVNGELTEKAVMIRYDADDLRSAVYTDFSGYSVRCIKE